MRINNSSVQVYTTCILSADGCLIGNNSGMSEDLLRQAELRHQRRPKSRQNEEILPLDVSKHKNPSLLIGDKLPSDGSCLPPIRHFGNYDKPPGGNVVIHGTADLQVSQSGSNLLSPVDKPRTPRRRIASHTDRSEVATDDNASDKENRTAVLPFIKCKLGEKGVKALISTISQRSTISHRLLEGVRCKNDTVMKAVVISGQEFHVNLCIQDSAMHDLVLGLDFMHENHCLLDFSAKELTLKSKARLTTPLLTEGDLPLKFRTRQGPASSF